MILARINDGVRQQKLRRCPGIGSVFVHRYLILIGDMSGCRPTLGRNQKTLMAVTGAVLPDY
jgi:hypothetical protein